MVLAKRSLGKDNTGTRKRSSSRSIADGLASMSTASGASATRERKLFADHRRKVHYSAEVFVLIQILFTFSQGFLDVTVNRPLRRGFGLGNPTPLAVI